MLALSLVAPNRAAGRTVAERGRGAETRAMARVTIPYRHAVLPVRFAIRSLRHRGRVIPRRTIANQPARIGDLRIEEWRDDELHRYVRAAKLFTDGDTRYSTALPELLDVRIVSMSPQAFTLMGFERIEGTEYAQSWLCTPAA